jgi:hypothetical protein
MFRRSLAATTAALVVLTLTASVVAAGGWAEIRADATTTSEPPVAGEPAEFGFTVLQHGVTPAGWVSPTVTFRDAATGQQVDAAVTAEGAEGHFLATVTLPTAGVWTMTVGLTELLTETPPTAVSVRTADGAAVPLDPAVALQAVEVARRDLTQQLNDSLYAEAERLDTERQTLAAQVTRLETQLDALQEEAAARAGESGDGGVQVIGMILLAILAGGAAGFVVAWLGGRSTPREVEVALGPAPRGTNPA